MSPAPRPRQPGEEHAHNIRFEVHLQATFPHETAPDHVELNQRLGDIEKDFRELGGEVAITFARTTRGTEEPKDNTTATHRQPVPSAGGFL